MAITYLTPQQVGPNAWIVRWSSSLSAPVFRVFRNGKLIAQTRGRSMLFDIPLGQQHDVEVLDDPDEIPKSSRGPIATLVWAQIPDATGYRVERLINAVWTPIGMVREIGDAQSVFGVEGLEDDQQHDFRVTSFNEGGDAVPAALDFTLVRTPDSPPVDMTYDSGTGKVTISAI